MIERYPVKTSTNQFCDTIATRIARYESIVAGPLCPLGCAVSLRTQTSPFALIGKCNAPDLSSFQWVCHGEMWRNPNL